MKSKLSEDEKDLTKLELVSAMCLQGLLSSDRKDAIYYTNTESRANYAIYNTKELIKQLKILKQLDL